MSSSLFFRFAYQSCLLNLALRLTDTAVDEHALLLQHAGGRRQSP